MATENDEALREALVELAMLREREAEALRASNALLAALNAIREADSPEKALPALLSDITTSLRADAAMIVSQRRGAATAIATTDAALDGLIMPAELLDAARRMRVADVRALPWWRSASPDLSRSRALLSMPITLSGSQASAIVCLSETVGRFTTADRDLLSRLAIVAEQALEALTLSERNSMLASVIEGSSSGIAIADAQQPETPLIYVNDAFTVLSGYAAEDVVGQNCRLLSAEAPASPERARLRRCVAAREAGEFMLLNRRKDGSTFWNRLTLFPVSDSQSRDRYLVATQTDISAEREARLERDAAQQRLSSALSVVSQGFLLVDASGVIVFANDQFRSFYDIDDARFVAGVSFHAAWSDRLTALGHDRETAEKKATERVRRLVAGHSEREETLADGKLVLVADHPTDDGGAVTMVADITSAKATERVLAQRAAAIDASQDGVAVTDEEGRFVYMNRSHMEMFGYQREEDVIGQHWSILYDKAHAERIEREAMPELGRNQRWRGETIGVTRVGAEVPQEVSLTLLDGIGLVCVTRDVSERKQIERERERLNEQVQAAQRQEAIGQLAAGIAHDFNNLLSVINTLATVLETRFEPQDEGREQLQRIASAGARAADLVARLLDLGRRDRDAQLLNLNDVVAEGLELLRAAVSVRVDVAGALTHTPIMIDADPTELLQLLLNLGINARDALAGDGGEIKISTRTRVGQPADPTFQLVLGAVAPDVRYAVIDVTDTGAGVDTERARQIFEPYFTTKGIDGTGLGLAVVASIVREADGAVFLRTAPGAGASFSVYLPLTRDAVAAVVAEPETPTQAAIVKDVVDALGGGPVLICDDLPEVGEALATLLEQADVEAAICEDPRDAYAAIVDAPDDWRLLITDFDMPAMNGAELAAATRIAAPTLPIILCSALAEARAHYSRFDAILSKPITRSTLWAAISKALLTSTEASPAARDGHQRQGGV